LTASIDDLESSGTTLLVDDYSPERALEDSNLSDELAAAIGQLPERDQLVLSLYYTEEMNLKEIGAILDVSESRISQILSKTTKALRQHIQY
jgi:RNA polymerase sigma factor for flagellar operon FliA